MDKYRSHPTPVFKKLADVITGEHVHVSVMQYQHLKGPIQKIVQWNLNIMKGQGNDKLCLLYKKVSIC